MIIFMWRVIQDEQQYYLDNATNISDCKKEFCSGNLIYKK